MTKIVINNCHGGFGLSNEAAEVLIDEYGWKLTEYTDEGSVKNPNADFVERTNSVFGIKYDIIGSKNASDLRTNPDLIDIVKRDDINADGPHSQLKIVEIPDGVEFQIEEYDGNEWVAEKHRTWY